MQCLCICMHAFAVGRLRSSKGATETNFAVNLPYMQCTLKKEKKKKSSFVFSVSHKKMCLKKKKQKWISIV